MAAFYAQRGYDLDALDVEVRATHLGLGFSPDVYCIVAQRLAQAPPREAA